jgi:hypothetical protein
MLNSKNSFLGLFLASAICAGAAHAQAKPDSLTSNSSAYDVKRESTLVGTVISYTQNSSTPPLGPHVSLQTSSGIVDVHLGNARLLLASHFAIQSGDTLRIIGENLAIGNSTQFVARVVQKGTQALAVRSARGIPLSYAAPRNSQSSRQGGVL